MKGGIFIRQNPLSMRTWSVQRMSHATKSKVEKFNDKGNSNFWHSRVKGLLTNSSLRKMSHTNRLQVMQMILQCSDKRSILLLEVENLEFTELQSGMALRTCYLLPLQLVMVFHCHMKNQYTAR